MTDDGLDLLGLIGRHVASTPNHEAVTDLSRRLTYGELYDEVSAVAGHLCDVGVEEGDRVALGMGNSVDFVVAALACAWVGAIFVPLASGDPPARRKFILDSCEPRAVLSPPAGLDPGPFLQLAMDDARRSRRPCPPPLPARDRPAYCVYTSGTTGSPKGVITGQVAFAAATLLAIDSMGIHQATRALCVSPVHFVGSFGTVFPAVAAGGTLVIPPRDHLFLPRMFFRVLASEEITHTSFSPTYLRLLLGSAQLEQLASSSLVTMGLGGESLTVGDLRSLFRAAPGLCVFNRYGQTETTGIVTAWPVRRESLPGNGSVPIGRPYKGNSFFIVGDDGRVIDAVGEPGELYIGGRQLMAGYWRDAELTASVLRDDVVAGMTLYRTGDIVFRDDAGVFFLVGRGDRMVKRSGIRISLLEVAAALCDLEPISGAVCTPYDNDGQLAIAAFVTTRGTASGRDVRLAAAAVLPATMLPDRVEIVDHLPMTAGSKVDERALLARAGLSLAREVVT
ncbi:MAG: AMP-binding protein [Acidimicrobiales bacterium]